MRGSIAVAVAASAVALSVALTLAQAPTPAGAPRAAAAPEKLSADAEAVLELDRQAELALNRSDVEFLRKTVFADDLVFTHGDAWTKSNTKGNTNTKEVWLNSIKSNPGQYSKKNANLQRIEMHGDIAIVMARSSGHLAASRQQPERDYEIWYVRVYNKRNGEWKLISHKTVRGPQDPTNPT
jgi:hypothetical protein